MRLHWHVSRCRFPDLLHNIIPFMLRDILSAMFQKYISCLMCITKKSKYFDPLTPNGDGKVLQLEEVFGEMSFVNPLVI